MLGLLFYIVVVTFATIILTFLWVGTRPIKRRDDFKSWRALAFIFVLCCAGPYAYVEVLTNWQGPKMLHAIKAAYNQTDIDGPMIYYKVLWYSGDHAKVLVVGKETENWGGTDHPMVNMQLERQGDGWVTASYRIVSSGRLNKDDFVFPAYW